MANDALRTLVAVISIFVSFWGYLPFWKLTSKSRPMFRSIWKWLNQPLKPPPPIESFVDPVFGNCQGRADFTGTWWWTTVKIPEYKSFRIFGRSPRPTTEQVSIWSDMRDRLPNLIRDARESIPEPPFKSYAPTGINVETADLNNIRLEPDGTVNFFFDLEIWDGHHEVCPLVVFKDGRIVESYWCV